MKLHIFGASGAGVTTLGHALSQALGILYFDSDDYFWEASDPPFTLRRPPAERDAALAADLARQPSWILGGSIVGWGEQWLTAFDRVVFLYIPLEVRMARLQRREYERYGNVIFTDPNRAAKMHAFLTWASGYEDGSSGGSRTLANHTAWLSQFGCPVLELRDDLTVTERLQRIQAWLPTVF